MLQKFLEYSFGHFVGVTPLKTGTLVSFHRRDGYPLGSYIQTGKNPEKEDALWREYEQLIKIDWLEHCWQI